MQTIWNGVHCKMELQELPKHSMCPSLVATSRNMQLHALRIRKVSLICNICWAVYSVAYVPYLGMFGHSASEATQHYILCFLLVCCTCHQLAPGLSQISDLNTCLACQNSDSLDSIEANARMAIPWLPDWRFFVASQALPGQRLRQRKSRF